MADGGATAALIVSALAAAGGAAQGADSARSARNARRRQAQAQDQAQARASSQQRQAQQAEARTNKRKPDLAAILAGVQGAGAGIGGTNLTGPSGVSNGSLQLGRTTKLGE